MRRVALISDINSLALAVGIVVFFLWFPGYQPPGETGLLIGVAVILVVMVLYVALEGIIVMRNRTATPVQFALETEFSHLPAYALVWVLAHWNLGAITISTFGWVVFWVVVAGVAFDLLGYTAMLAQRLLLTDEYKGVR